MRMMIYQREPVFSPLASAFVAGAIHVATSYECLNNAKGSERKAFLSAFLRCARSEPDWR